MNVTTNVGGTEGLAIDEREVVYLARLKLLKRQPWLNVWRRDLD